MLMHLFKLSIQIIWMKLSKHTERLFDSYKKRKFFSCDRDYVIVQNIYKNPNSWMLSKERREKES